MYLYEWRWESVWKCAFNLRSIEIVKQSVVHEVSQLKLIYLSSFIVIIRNKQLI